MEADHHKQLRERLTHGIRSVPNFPKEGILFRDIGSLLKDVKLWKDCVEAIANRYKGKHVDKVAGMESRGFIVGLPVAMALGVPFLMMRKPNKLPGNKVSCAYGLEYGKDTLELNCDDVVKGEHILIVDDLLATGGTAKAASTLVELAGAKVAGCCFLIELDGLNGRGKLSGTDVWALVSFPADG